MIQPNVQDWYGGMPKRNESGSLEFSNHRDIYCGFLDELYENGARIVEMYEVLHFDQSQKIVPF